MSLVWEQFIAILSLKSVTCEVCRLAASLQNRTLPEINSLSWYASCCSLWVVYGLFSWMTFVSAARFKTEICWRVGLSTRRSVFGRLFIAWRSWATCLSMSIFYDRFTGSRSSIRLWWSSSWWVSSAWSSCERCEKTMRATVKRTTSMKWYAESQC